MTFRRVPAHLRGKGLFACLRAGLNIAQPVSVHALYMYVMR